jgi:hypothetical protein
MNRHTRLIPLLLALLSTAALAGESALQLSPLLPTVRARPTGDLPPSCDPLLHAARNEYESLQIAITAGGSTLHKVDAKIGPFKNAAGDTLPEGSALLYREAFVPIHRSAPRATEAPGLMPDSLVPFLDPYTGEKLKPARWDGKALEGASYGGAPFDIWEDHHEILWLDVHVPAQAAPGDYTAMLVVSAGNATAAALPITLTVWDFTLPPGPTHENHFGGFGRLASYHGLDGKSEEFFRLEERYSESIAQHRINPELPRHLQPAIGEDGTPDFSAEVDAGISAFVERHHLTNIQIPRAPFSDPAGANREKALRFFRGWHDYLAGKGWADRAYHYMLDEPNTPEAYDKVRALGALVHEANPAIRCLVVEQPYTQDPAWGTLDEAVDIWCPLFGFVEENEVKRVKGKGDDVWSYTALVQPAPKYHPNYEQVKDNLPPFWQMDFPVTAYRIAPWLNRRYGITGLLYWSMVYYGSPDRNPWQDPGFRVRWNGEGALFYPGDAVGIDGPIASIRLKNLRDGMEDYEYFALLEERGGLEAVEAIVREAVPTWGTWNSAPHALPKLRQRLAEEIVRRGR